MLATHLHVAIIPDFKGLECFIIAPTIIIARKPNLVARVNHEVQRSMYDTSLTRDANLLIGRSQGAVLLTVDRYREF
jgi:hypothetical protein